MSFMNNSMFGHNSSSRHGSANSSFGHNSNSSIISHSSIHESKYSTNFHSDIHNHNKIHESMHFGNDNIRSPLNHHPKNK